MPLTIRHAGLTDVGRKRTHNEDNLKTLPEHQLYLVADGMGGHEKGEVASEMAVDTVASFYQESGRVREVTWPYRRQRDQRYEENRMAASIKLANARIFDATSRTSQQRMGTTLVALHVAGEQIYMGHVGDSRIYRLRGEELTQITEDHSLLNDYKRTRNLTPEEIEAFPYKNVIVRALGMHQSVQVDVIVEEPEEGDLYLMCSDGLNAMITDEAIRRIMIEHRNNLKLACKKLIEGANSKGGVDNITTVLIETRRK